MLSLIPSLIMALCTGFLKVYEELAALIVDKIVPSYNLPEEAKTWMKEVRRFALCWHHACRSLSSFACVNSRLICR